MTMPHNAQQHLMWCRRTDGCLDEAGRPLSGFIWLRSDGGFDSLGYAPTSGRNRSRAPTNGPLLEFLRGFKAEGGLLSSLGGLG